jgi:hypothetical protein
LLHQVLKSEKGPKVIKYALRAFEENGKKISQSFDAMWEIIQNITLDPDCGKIVFLLDALDECELSEQKRLITKLKLLEQRQNALGISKNVKFFITSRPYWDIEKEFDSLISDIPGIRIKGENQSTSLRSEIDHVIEARVENLNRRFTGQQAKELLLHGLLKAENRTYLWLHLVFDRIESESRIDTEMATSLVQELPPTVDAAYNAILLRSKDQAKATKLLHIVVAATRPLFLLEVGIALYIKEGTRTIAELELQNEEQLQTTLRDLCGLFVTFINDRVYLLHQTAKEFLIARNNLDRPTFDLSSHGNWKHSISIQQSNYLLAQICIWRLQLKAFEESQYQGQDNVYRNFYEYSVVNWTAHFHEANIEYDAEIIPLAVTLCNPNTKEFRRWNLIISSNREELALTTLIVASIFGLQGVVKLLLDMDTVETDSKDKYSRTPLSHAAEKGYETIVKLLLDTGIVDANSKDNSGRTPLLYAAMNGHETIVKLLLDIDIVDADSKDKYGQTPLSYAAMNGHKTIVKLLLDIDIVDADSKDKDGQTPLSYAAMNGHKTIVKLLLDTGIVDAKSKDNFGRMPLSYAAKHGHRAIVTILKSATK